MTGYNKSHELNEKVAYYAQAGDYSAKGLRFRKRLKWRIRRRIACGRKECDSWVSVPSAHYDAKGRESSVSLQFDTEKYSCDGGDQECKHKKIHSSKESFEFPELQRHVIENPGNRLFSAFSRLDRRMLNEEDCGNDDEEEDLDDLVIYVDTLAGTLTGVETSSVDFVVDEETLLIVTVHFPPGEVTTDLQLVAPSGARISRDDDVGDDIPEPDEDEVFDGDDINPILDAIPSDAIIFEAGDPILDDEISSYLFYIKTPEVGTWTAEVSNPLNTGTMDYMVTVEYMVSTIEFTAQLVSPEFSSVGEPLSLEARLFEEGTPISGATVTATFYLIEDTGIQEIATEIMSTAGDGIYSMTTSTLGSGQYLAQVSAEGERQSAASPFTRQFTLFATILEASSSILGVERDRGEDFDGDGLFDALAFDITLDINVQGFYRVTGILEDFDGNEYRTDGSGELNVGEQEITLRFDGSLLLQNQSTGPYTLKVIRLADAGEDGDGFVLGILDELCPDYTTSEYNFVDFEIDEDDRVPPTAVCVDVEVPTDPGQCVAAGVSIDGGSKADSVGELTQHPSGPYSVGATAVLMEAISYYGYVDSCFGTIVVKDEEAPTINCGEVNDIFEDEAPVTFRPTATDNCDSEIDIDLEYLGFECFKLSEMGEQIPSQCEIETHGFGFQIKNNGGKGTQIKLIVQATDSSGNAQTKTCSLAVIDKETAPTARPSPSSTDKPTTRVRAPSASATKSSKSINSKSSKSTKSSKSSKSSKSTTTTGKAAKS